MILVWHRADLRTHDHPALFSAIQQNQQCVPVFVLDPSLLVLPYSGQVRVQFLYANLLALNNSYKKLGSALVLRAGSPETEILKLAQDCKATGVYALKSFEPIGRARDERLAKILQDAGIELKLFDGDCIIQPGQVLNGQDEYYKVFTPFYNRWLTLPMNAPLPGPQKLLAHNISGLSFPEPSTNISLPVAGEEHAMALLQNFVTNQAGQYLSLRDTPSNNAGTSGLSAYLHLGVLSPRLAAQSAQAFSDWVRELCWRDFYRHILWHEPRLASEAFKKDWNAFPWRDHAGEAKKDFAAWCNGQTGYPIVDAGMRQLKTTGLMHNRVRMIVASFLCKHLLISWQAGEAFFNEHLLDGDLATNNGSWQWSAGCGVDAAPYFRVFNPVSQGQKFDADALYIKTFLQELAGLNNAEAHQPWACSIPPQNYPTPIIPLAVGRQRFLESAKTYLQASQVR